jgi:hypothetical protein
VSVPAPAVHVVLHCHPEVAVTTFPTARVDVLAVLRLDGDYDESTIQILESLSHKVSPGGFVIVDDCGAIEGCPHAVTDFRTANRIGGHHHWRRCGYRLLGIAAPRTRATLSTKAC